MIEPIFNRLRYFGTVLAADASTVIMANAKIGCEELSGRDLELAQLHSSETTVRFTLRANAEFVSSCYVSFEGSLYPVDYVRDPGVSVPSPGQVMRGILVELYAHRIKG